MARRASTRKRRARRRSASAEAAIVSAAAALVAERGYLGTTIEAIAARAGVGKQTIYRWWGDKAGLFVDVYARLAPARALAVDTGSLGGDVRLLLGRLFSIYRRTPAANILAGLVAEAQADARVARRLAEQHVAPRRAILADVLRRAAGRGELRRRADQKLAAELVSAFVWFRLLGGAGALDRRAASRLADLLLKGVGR
jgi:AcrR family transcriptional regulator